MIKTERDCTLSIKVSQEEREILQARAQNLNMNVSEFVRLATLSDSSKSISLIAENARLNDKVKELQVNLSLGNKPVESESTIVLPCTKEQKEIILKIYGNYYNEERSAELQILNYLIEDAMTPHWTFDHSSKLKKGDFLPLGDGTAALALTNRKYRACAAKVSAEEIFNAFKKFHFDLWQDDVDALNEQ